MTTVQAGTGVEDEKSTSNKLSIVMFSGTADKFIPLGVLAQAARRWAWTLRYSSPASR